MTRSVVDRVSKHKHLITIFNKLNSKQKRSVQKNLDLDQIKFLIEVFYNIITGELEVPGEVKDHLKKYKRSLRIVTNRRTPLKKKVVKLQTGRFLMPILQLLAGSVVPTLLNKLIENNGQKNK